jgi:3-deoxy-D-arabino-heptulosonate 7-phosphate (DAHP) synthase
MVKWIRDYETLSKKQKILTAVSAIVIRSYLSITIDHYTMHQSLMRSLANLALIAGASTILIEALQAKGP